MTESIDEILRVLHRRMSESSGNPYLTARIANLIGELKHLQSPINAIHEARLKQLVKLSIALLGNTARPGGDD